MKKIAWLLLICMLVVVSSGCGNKTQIEENSSQAQETKPEPKEEPMQIENTQSNTKSPVKGIKFTVSGAERQGIIKGTEVAEELAWDKGSYIIGKNKPEDSHEYEVFLVTIEVKNETDKVINISEMGWKAKLSDGYELMISMELAFSGQVRSNGSKEGKIKVIVDKSFNADKFLLIYDYLNYDDEWSKALSEAITGKITPEEYLAKYTPIPIEWELTI